jgi:hypothetical protein
MKKSIIILALMLIGISAFSFEAKAEKKTVAKTEAKTEAKTPKAKAMSSVAEAPAVATKAPVKEIPEKFKKVSVGDKMPAFLL